MAIRALAAMRPKCVQRYHQPQTPVTLSPSLSDEEEDSPEYDDTSLGEESNEYKGSSLGCAECDVRFTSIEVE